MNNFNLKHYLSALYYHLNLEENVLIDITTDRLIQSDEQIGSLVNK